MNYSLEILNDAHQSLLRVDFDAAPIAYIRAYNRLFDACLGAGMDYAEDPADWAAIRVARWLCEA